MLPELRREKREETNERRRNVEKALYIYVVKIMKAWAYRVDKRSYNYVSVCDAVKGSRLTKEFNQR